MKNILIVLFLLISTISFSQKNQTNLKSEINIDAYSLTTFLKVKQTGNQFLMTSPKNADVRLFGWFKAKLARIFGKSPKKGILATINCVQKGDSLVGNMNISMLGSMKFKGTYKNEILKGNIIKNDTIIIGTIKGTKSKENSIDYNHLYNKMMKITNNNIYSKSVIQTEEWNKFQKQLKKTLNKVQDDVELFFGFQILSPKPPFSHYNLLLLKEKTVFGNKNKIEIKKTVTYKKENENTTYLKIKNFETSQNELANIFPKIIKDNPKNLIIDLRDNLGGGIEAGFEFGKHIMSGTTEIGYFTTNKLQNIGFDKDLFEKLPDAEPQTTDEFIENLKQDKGAKLIFKNINKPVYLGNIYVLTNKNTASTCEPIVYRLKESKRATIVGENTAGAMLSATIFEISGKYKLFLPIADFYTYDGIRLEGVGVKPNIETKSEDALDKVLEIIKSK